MNWGTGIALFYGAFVLSMVGAVFASRKHDPGLVQKNYYELDLNYQARLEQKQNTAALGTLPQIQFDAPAQKVQITFPDGMTASSGAVKMYRSTTTGDDFTVKIENTAACSIPVENLTQGRWHLELDWVADGKKYFLETAFFVSHTKI